MQKIVSIQLDSICADIEGTEKLLQHACSQPSGRYRIRGICQAGETVYATLLPSAPEEANVTYHIIQIQDTTSASMTSLLGERWAAGFDAIGSVNLPDGLLLVLFAEVLHEVV